MTDEIQGFILNAERHLFEPAGAIANHLLTTPHGDFALLSAEVDEDVLIGQPIYLKQNGHLTLACADSSERAQIVGLVLEDKATGNACKYTVTGAVTREDWSAIAASILLKVGQIYYLDVIKGMLTDIPLELGYLVVVGRALSTNTLSIQIQPTILLSKLIEVT